MAISRSVRLELQRRHKERNQTTQFGPIMALGKLNGTQPSGQMKARPGLLVAPALAQAPASPVALGTEILWSLSFSRCAARIFNLVLRGPHGSGALTELPTSRIAWRGLDPCCPSQASSLKWSSPFPLRLIGVEEFCNLRSTVLGSWDLDWKSSISFWGVPVLSASEPGSHTLSPTSQRQGVDESHCMH